MGFLKTFEEITKNRRETFDFYDAEVLIVLWETKPDIVKRLLPPPLKPARKPLATALVANYPRTNFGVSYLESALFLRAEFNGEEGDYCLSMPLTNDMAMAAGREVFGYPKKIANIQFNRRGKVAEGLAERHRIRFFEVRAELTGKFNVDEAQDIFGEVFGTGGSFVLVHYNFKHFLSPEGMGFDYHPRLVREEVEVRPNSTEAGKAEILLRPSDYEPWVEVEILRPLGAIYTIGNNSMRKGKVVAEVDPMAFAPYAFLKWDL